MAVQKEKVNRKLEIRCSRSAGGLSWCQLRDDSREEKRGLGYFNSIKFVETHFFYAANKENNKSVATKTTTRNTTDSRLFRVSCEAADVCICDVMSIHLHLI